MYVLTHIYLMKQLFNRKNDVPTSVILAFIVAFDSSVHTVSVSPRINRLFSVTQSRTLGLGRRRYGRLFLPIAGFFCFTDS